MSCIARRLLRDEAAVTYTEYVIITLAIVAGAISFSRLIIPALNRYLRRIYMVVTLPFP
jgi:Flp pilus assembly pilin Flp